LRFILETAIMVEIPETAIKPEKYACCTRVEYMTAETITIIITYSQ
jgi:hypothetical protein